MGSFFHKYAEKYVERIVDKKLEHALNNIEGNRANIDHLSEASKTHNDAFSGVVRIVRTLLTRVRVLEAHQCSAESASNDDDKEKPPAV